MTTANWNNTDNGLIRKVSGGIEHCITKNGNNWRLVMQQRGNSGRLVGGAIFLGDFTTRDEAQNTSNELLTR